MEKPSTFKKVITYLALFLFLIVLPAGSWLFLDKGADFYRGVMAELADYGSMPDFKTFNSQGKEIEDENFEKKLTIVGFYTENQNPKSLGMMRYVYDQFTENPGVEFLTINTTNNDSIFNFNRFIKQNKIQKEKWHYIQSSSFHENIKPKENHPIKERLLLIDTSQTVRNYYPYTDTISINRLITTMSLLMPRPPKAEIVFEREKEK